MLSKITVDTGDDFKPLIKILERKSDDVRDKMVVSLRSQLNFKSKTFSWQINQIGIDGTNEILLMPVSDEISYFRERLRDLLCDGKEIIHVNQSKLIDDFLFWIQNPDTVSYIERNGVKDIEVSNPAYQAAQQNIQGA